MNYTKKYQRRKEAKIRNRYNQAPHLTQDTNGKATTFKKTYGTCAMEKKKQAHDASELFWR